MNAIKEGDVPILIDDKELSSLFAAGKRKKKGRSKLASPTFVRRWLRQQSQRDLSMLSAEYAVTQERWEDMRQGLALAYSTTQKMKAKLEAKKEVAGTKPAKYPTEAVLGSLDEAITFVRDTVIMSRKASSVPHDSKGYTAMVAELSQARGALRTALTNLEASFTLDDARRLRLTVNNHIVRATRLLPGVFEVRAGMELDLAGIANTSDKFTAVAGETTEGEDDTKLPGNTGAAGVGVIKTEQTQEVDNMSVSQGTKVQEAIDPIHRAITHAGSEAAPEKEGQRRVMSMEEGLAAARAMLLGKQAPAPAPATATVASTPAPSVPALDKQVVAAAQARADRAIEKAKNLLLGKTPVVTTVKKKKKLKGEVAKTAEGKSLKKKLKKDLAKLEAAVKPKLKKKVKAKAEKPQTTSSLMVRLKPKAKVTAAKPTLDEQTLNDSRLLKKYAASRKLLPRKLNKKLEAEILRMPTLAIFQTHPVHPSVRGKLADAGIAATQIDDYFVFERQVVVGLDMKKVKQIAKESGDKKYRQEPGLEYIRRVILPMAQDRTGQRHNLVSEMSSASPYPPYQYYWIMPEKDINKLIGLRLNVESWSFPFRT